jgi:hypothetical protein
MLLRIENVSEENCNKLEKCKFGSRLCIQIPNEVPCSCRNLHHFFVQDICHRECSTLLVFCMLSCRSLSHSQLCLKGAGPQMNIFFIAFYIKSGLSVHCSSTSRGSE